MLDAVIERGVADASALEVGGGVGPSDRVDRQQLDFAGEGQDVASADIVVHRVICCYPDMVPGAEIR